MFGVADRSIPSVSIRVNPWLNSGSNRSRRSNPTTLPSSLSRLGLVDTSEDNQMLPRQRADRLNMFEGERTHLFLHLRFCHFVERLDRHFRVFPTVFDKGNPATRLQISTDRRHHLRGLTDLVIHIDHCLLYTSPSPRD